MSDSVQGLNSSSSLPLSTQDLFFRQSLEQTRQTEISLTTAEGDHVTISRSFASMQSLEYESHVSTVGRELSLVASNLTTGAYSLTVEGDLNEEELADIKDLLKDLHKVGKAFFRGNMEKAVAKALKIGDTGTITEMSASFSYTSSMATTLIESHPIPAPIEDFSNQVPYFNDLLDDDLEELPSYSEILKGQWEQILQVMEDIQEETAGSGEASEEHATNLIASDPTETGHKMLDRTIDTLAKHPRLSPFAIPMHGRIINQAHADTPRFPGSNGLANRLQNEFARAFNNWLAAD